MWIHDMFGADKPIIALLHLDALPGDPGFCGDMDVVLDHAAHDLTALQDGGVDGILIANEFSLPYQPVADIAVISAMAYIIGKLKDRIRVPFGVNVVQVPALGGAVFQVHIWESMGSMSLTAERPSGTERLWEWSTLSSCLR